MDHLRQVAQGLGYSSVRDFQASVVTAYCRKEDVFLTAPTGAGKSFVYEVSPFMLDSVCVDKIPTKMALIISPLIALMEAQVNKLRIHFIHILMSNEYSEKGCTW